jgi:UDP-2,3-diacylglucosamine pyrophosphatase LpxH
MPPTLADAELPRVFVISDVHIGGGELDDFVPALEQKLLQFIDTLSRLAQPVHLVINGDFFDFATAAPWEGGDLESTTTHGLRLCFTEAQSCSKLERIIASHGAVFDALARLLAAKPDNRISMMPGNHDPDLFWRRVRERIIERLGEAIDSRDSVERFEFVLERQLVLERGGERYWIEHGHQHDPPNSFFPNGRERWSAADPPLFRDRDQQWRVYECPGTLGLLRHINHWRLTYRSISYIKPYSKVLSALIWQGALRAPGRPLMILRHLVAYLGWEVDLQTTLSAGDIEIACYQAIQDLMDSLSAEEEAELKAHLAAGGLTVDRSLSMFVQTPLNRKAIVEQVAREAFGDIKRPALEVSKPTLGFARDGRLDNAETEALRQMAWRLVKEKSAEYVLTGHTHMPCQMLDGRFTNGGCWIPNQVVETKKNAATIIFDNAPVAYRLSYIEIWRRGPPHLRCFGRGTIEV